MAFSCLSSCVTSSATPPELSPEGIAKYVTQRRQALYGLQLPGVLAASSTLVVAIDDTLRKGRVSPVFALCLAFTIVSMVLGHSATIDQGTRDVWKRVMAFLILSYIFVVFWIVGYHDPLHDLGNIRAASTYLSVFIAVNAHEAMLYLVIHFFLCLKADLPNMREEMVMLIITDIYLIGASWGKDALRDSLTQLLGLSQNMSKRVKRRVQETLHYLCDAVVVVDEELELLEPAPELGCLLSRNVTVGRCLPEMCHHESLETLVSEAKAHFESFKRDEHVHREAVQVRLMDCYAQPFSVHLFVAVVAPQEDQPERPYAIMGISEQWNRKHKDRITDKSSKTFSPMRSRRSAQLADGRSQLPTTDPPSLASRRVGNRTQVPVSDPELRSRSGMQADSKLGCRESERST